MDLELHPLVSVSEGKLLDVYLVEDQTHKEYTMILRVHELYITGTNFVVQCYVCMVFYLRGIAHNL